MQSTDGWTRREVIRVLGALGFSSAAAACGAPPGAPSREGSGPPVTTHEPPEVDTAHTESIRALMDALLPAERDAAGQLLSPGALEAGAEEVLRIDNFVVLAKAQGLLQKEPEGIATGAFDVAFRSVINADLEVLANAQRPLTPFSRLPPELRDAAIAAGFDDPVRRPGLEFVRAVCFIAFLGAVSSDAGLVAVGFPPFEDFAAGLAVSGYPRTRSGRRVDAATEDLAALAAAGDLDDYTYNRAPEPTLGDDLSAVLNEEGDLL